MRAIVLLTCLVLSCLAQRPHPCRSPPLLTGSMSILSEEETVYAKYSYDAFGKRVRIRNILFAENKTFQDDALLLYREGVIYKINDQNRTCTKEKLARDFHPMEVPENASLMGQVVLGSSSGPGEGLLVNTWTGELKSGRYMSTFTEFGCFPVSTLAYGDHNVWILMSYFNIQIGVEDPQEFFPPEFCQDAQLDNEREPADFYSLFLG